MPLMPCPVTCSKSASGLRRSNPATSAGFFPDSCQRQHRARIFGVFPVTQHTVLLPDCRFHILVIGVKVFLRDLHPGACQPENQPVSANRTVPRRGDLRLQIAGRFFSWLACLPQAVRESSSDSRSRIQSNLEPDRFMRCISLSFENRCGGTERLAVSVNIEYANPCAVRQLHTAL